MRLNIVEMLKLSQEDLLQFNYIQLLKRHYKYEDILYTKDYVYAKGRIPILLIAHCDTVHRKLPETIVYDRKQKILWSPEGIGGDDRCGVYAILKICEKYKPYVLFTTDEEIGGVGATKVTQEINNIPVKFMIEIDRRGNNQVVYYKCGNEDFQKYIESFDFDKQYGSFSDVSTLSTFYDIAGCNVSAGYYNEHTNTEHIFLEHLYNTISKIKRILRDYDSKYYDCKETKTYYCGKCYDYYDYYDDYLPSNNKADKNNVEVTEIEDDEFKSYLEMEDDFYDLTKQEWYEKYGKPKPKDVLDIYFKGDIYEN